MAWMVVATSDSYAHIKTPRTAMVAGVPDEPSVHVRGNDATADLVQGLLFNIPDLTWTIEVDLMGHHRVTIHFKGMEIGVDE